MLSLKAFAFYLVFISISNSSLFSQNDAWSRIQPTPQEHSLYCVRQIPGTETIVAVGDGSTIMYSDDDGESWDITLNPAGLPNSTLITDVNFFNFELGYALTFDGKIIKTENGGQDWFVVFVEENYTPDWVYIQIPADIYFIDHETLIIVGIGDQILKSSDAGNNWIVIDSPEGFTPYAIDFINSESGFIVGNSIPLKVLKTTDQGDSWNTQETGFDDLIECTDITFTNDTTGFIASTSLTGEASTTIYKTIDAGETWNEVYSSGVGFGLGEIHFKDESTGAATLFSWWNSFLYTSDGGETWIHDEDYFFNWYHPCYSFYFSTEYFLGVGEVGRIGRLTELGGSWEKFSDRWIGYDRFATVQFTSSQTGYLLTYDFYGAYDDIYKTNDAGKSWNRVNTQELITVSNFNFLNDELGYLITYDTYDDAFIIWKTNNGGDNWIKLSNLGESDFYQGYRPCISFFDSINGLTTIWDKLFKTIDGGISWQKVLDLNNDSKEIHNITYLSKDTVIATISYSNPQIIKSFDGGNTFEFDTVDIYRFSADKMYFSDRQIGYLLINSYDDYDTGFIYKTIDGGETWYNTIINDTNTQSFNDIFFTSENIGYAAGTGQYANLLKTEDGGETWNPLDTHCSSGLSELHFFDDIHGLVFGNNGIIMETMTGGVVGLEENPFVETEPFFTVYPNPSNHFVQIKLEEPIENNLLIEIINLNGECVYRKYHFDSSAENIISINLASLPSGIYLCRISDGGKLSTRKVVKL